jgi:hypothetical protein
MNDSIDAICGGAPALLLSTSLFRFAGGAPQREINGRGPLPPPAKFSVLAHLCSLPSGGSCGAGLISPALPRDPPLVIVTSGIWPMKKQWLSPWERVASAKPWVSI